jgi:hypothetical protein
MEERDGAESETCLDIAALRASRRTFGFVAAMIVVRVLSLQTRPALATLSVCCSIACIQ